MILKDMLVPMPEKKIVTRTYANGSVYVYYRIRTYRNEKGQPTNDVVAIGKKDTASGKLIPNQRYFDFFPDSNYQNPKTITPKLIKACGNVAAMMEIANQTELLSTLKKSIPTKCDQLLATAFYMICEGNVMMYIGDWFENNNVNFTEHMTDIDCSKLFASITEEEKRLFFSEWIKIRGEQEHIAYDVTSVSTHSQNNEIAEWGFNRDNEKLPQINLGLFYGVSSNMPIYYHTYSGSIPDKVCLEYMMATAKDLGISNTSFVFDCGFVTEENFLYMYENNIPFITAMPGNRTAATNLIDKFKNSIEKSGNRIRDYDVYGVAHPTSMYGQEIQAHIFFDQERRLFETNEIYAYIDKLEAELIELSKAKKQVTKRFKEIFIINEQPKSSFTYELDTEKIDAKLSRAGYFILLCTNRELKSKAVLKTYREKDTIEKNFDQFKNRLDFKRFRTHWKATMEGKIFVGFIALILRTYMKGLIKKNDDLKKVTFEKMLIELNKIKSVTMSDNKSILMPLTKLQKDILSTLKVNTALLEM
jgi:transposase